MDAYGRLWAPAWGRTRAPVCVLGSVPDFAFGGRNAREDEAFQAVGDAEVDGQPQSI